MPKLFTIEEANSLIPWLEHQISTLLRHKEACNRLLIELEEQGITDEILQQPTQDEPLLRCRYQLQQLMQQVNQIIADIHSRGCLVKNIELGLVDFYGLIEKTEVCFCWQLGEPHITHWHKLTEGFRNRKPLLLANFGHYDKTLH